MPTYEYECTKCGNRFEKMQAMSAPPEKKCPACGGKVDKLISAGAVHVKNPAAAGSPCGGVCPHAPGRRPCGA
jgi:putative FmdB family regulatory protein